MKLSDKYKKEFNLEEAKEIFLSASEATIEKMSGRENCGLFEIRKNNKSVAILCQSELENFLFGFYLAASGV